MYMSRLVSSIDLECIHCLAGAMSGGSVDLEFKPRHVWSETLTHVTVKCMQLFHIYAHDMQ